MVKSISNIQFGSAIGAMDKVSKEQLYNPGLYALQNDLLLQPHPPRDRGVSFLGFLGRLVLTAGIVLGAPLLARKHLKMIRNVDLEQKLAKDAKFIDKGKYHLAKFGEWVDKNILGKLKSAMADSASKPKEEAGKNAQMEIPFPPHKD